MAGEERFKVFVEVITELNDRAFQSALNNVNALASRAATPGTGSVAGAGTGSLASQSVAVQRQVNELASRAIGPAAAGISKALLTEVSALANGGVIAAVSSALGSRTTGRVSPERFTAAINAAQATTLAEMAATTRAQAAITANTRLVAASTAGQAEIAARANLQAAQDEALRVRRIFAGPRLENTPAAQAAIGAADKDVVTKGAALAKAQYAVNKERFARTQEQAKIEKDDAEAERAASAKYLKELYTPVAAAAAAGRPPIRPAIGPGGGGFFGGGGNGQAPPGAAAAGGGGGGGADDALAAYAAILKRVREALEAQRAAVLESLVYLRELLTSGQDLISAQAEEAALKRTAAALQKQQTEAILAGEQLYIDATAEAASLRRASAARIATLEREGVGLERVATTFLPPGAQGTDAELRAQVLAALQQEESAEKVKARLASASAKIAENELLMREDNAAILAQENASNREMARALKLQTARIESATFEQGVLAGNVGRGTFTQRAQAFIAQRRTGDFRPPTDFLEGKQLLASRFLTTASFAVSGLATFAAFAGLQALVKDSKELERVLATVHAQFDSLGQSAGFNKFRQGILDISHDVGVGASQVAALSSAFKGAFGQGAGGNLSDNQVLTQVRSAVEFSKVTGVSLGEIQNSLIATAKVYGVDVRSVADATLLLQQRTGVAAKEILEGLGVVAPVADQAGLSLDQMGGIIATAAQLSGRSAAAIAENFARVLPEIQKNTIPLIQFFNSLSAGAGKQVESALLGGKPGEIIDLIGRNYDKLNKNQQDYVVGLIGSRRDTQALIGAFKDYPQVLRNIDAAQNSQGTTAQAYARLQETLAQQLSRVGAAFKVIGEALLRLGLSQVFQDVAKALGAVASVASDIIGFFGDMNDTLGGIPGKVAAFAFELYGLYRVLKLIRAFQASDFALGAFSGLVGRGAGAAVGSQALNAADVFAGTGAGAAAATSAGGGGLLGRLVGAGGTGLLGGTAARVGTGVLTAGTAAASLASTLQLLDPSGIGIASLVTGIFDHPDNKQSTPIEKQRLGDAAKEDATKTRDELRGIYGQAYGGALKDESHGSGTLGDRPFVSQLFETGKSDAGDKLASLSGIEAELNAKDSSPESRRSNTALLEYRKRQISDKTAIINKLVETGKIKKENTTEVLASDNIGDYTKFLDEQSHKGIDVKAAETATGQDSQNAKQFAAKVQNQALAEAKFAAGVTGSGQFLGELKNSRDEARRVLDDALRNPNTDPTALQNALKDYKDNNDKFNQLAKQIIDANIQFAQFKTQISGAPKDVQLKSTLSVINQQIGTSTDPQERRQLAGQYLAASQELVQFLVSRATSLDAAWKAAHTPVPIPESVQQALTETALDLNVDASAAIHLAALALNVSYESLNHDIAKAIVAGKNGRTFIRDVLEAQINHLIAQAEELAAAGKDDAAVDTAINNLLAALAALGGPGGKAIGGTKSDKQLLIDQATIDYSKQKAIVDAQGQIDQANAKGDPFKLAEAQRAQADADLKFALKLPKGPEREAAIKGALAKRIEADNAMEQATNDLAKSRLDITAAYVAQDPVKAAQVAIQQADQAYSQAHSDAERNEATAAKIRGQQQLQQALTAVSTANLGVLAAIYEDDPVKSAQIAIDQAKLQYANAQDDASRANALAAEIHGQHSLRDALAAAADAQKDVLIALANARGDTIEAARLSFEKSQEDYIRLIASGVDPKSEKGAASYRNLIEQQANLKTTTVNENENDIQFDLDLHKISTAQAIARLEALKAKAAGDKHLMQDLERKIYELKHQAGQALQFNLPDIVLPTFYEARRLAQQGAGGFQASYIGSGQNYTDNRQINVFAQTNASAKDIANAVAAEMNKPSTFGTRRGLY